VISLDNTISSNEAQTHIGQPNDMRFAIAISHPNHVYFLLTPNENIPILENVISLPKAIMSAEIIF